MSLGLIMRHVFIVRVFDQINHKQQQQQQQHNRRSSPQQQRQQRQPLQRRQHRLKLVSDTPSVMTLLIE